MLYPSRLICRQNARISLSSMEKPGKGRDWYDFEWYIRNRIPLDFKHLQERIKEFNGCEKSKEEFIADLEQRLRSADIKQVKVDVMPFIKNPKDMTIWSNEYFLQLAKMINIE